MLIIESDYQFRTLRLTVDYLLEKHKLEFVDMVEKISESKAICESFVSVANKLFEDRKYSWGRVATLYAFSACLADYCDSNHIGQDMVRKIGETVGKYVSDNLADWIYSQGGWVLLNIHFHKSQNYNHNLKTYLNLKLKQLVLKLKH